MDSTHRSRLQVSWRREDAEGEECICTICDCGKHHCPVHKTATLPFSSESSYKNDYPRRECPLTQRRRQAARPERTPADPEQFISKNMEDYVTHHQAPVKSAKPEPRKLVSVPFTSESTHKQEFVPRPLEHVQPCRHQDHEIMSGPFDGTTTNKEMHRAPEFSPPVKGTGPARKEVKSLPFEGTSVYQNEYVQRPLQEKKRSAPVAPYEYGPSREFNTENRDQYTPKKGEERRAGPPPAAAAKTLPFNGTTSYKAEFPKHDAHALERRKRAAPGVVQPSDEGQFTSKYVEDFVPHSCEREKSKKPATRERVTVPFTALSTNQSEYVSLPLVHTHPILPSNNTIMSGSFDGTTTNHELYKAPVGASPRRAIAPAQQQVKTLPFNASTQYKADYLPREVEMRKAKPAPAEYEYGPKREFDTENRAQYTPKQAHHCPVLDLEPKPPNPRTGHVHYTKRDTRFL